MDRGHYLTPPPRARLTPIRLTPTLSLPFSEESKLCI